MLRRARRRYFELLTAAAFAWFAEVAVDVAVVEVGPARALRRHQRGRRPGRGGHQRRPGPHRRRGPTGAGASPRRRPASSSRAATWCSARPTPTCGPIFAAEAPAETCGCGTSTSASIDRPARARRPRRRPAHARRRATTRSSCRCTAPTRATTPRSRSRRSRRSSAGALDADVVAEAFGGAAAAGPVRGRAPRRRSWSSTAPTTPTAPRPRRRRSTRSSTWPAAAAGCCRRAGRPRRRRDARGARRRRAGRPGHRLHAADSPRAIPAERARRSAAAAPGVRGRGGRTTVGAAVAPWPLAIAVDDGDRSSSPGSLTRSARPACRRLRRRSRSSRRHRRSHRCGLGRLVVRSGRRRPWPSTYLAHHGSHLRHLQARRRRARPRRRDRRPPRAQGPHAGAPPSCARSTERLAEEHYAEHHGKPFYGDLVAFITRSPVVAMVVEGPEDNSGRGPHADGRHQPATTPRRAPIRGDLGTMITENLVHGSATRPSRPSARSRIWFPEL